MTAAVDVLALLVTVSCVGLTLLVGIQTATARYRWTSTGPRLLATEGLTVLLAVADVATLLAGHDARELPAHLAYLTVSVVVLPATVSQVRGDDGRWAGALVVLALAVLAVVVVRQTTTWRTGG